MEAPRETRTPIRKVTHYEWVCGSCFPEVVLRVEILRANVHWWHGVIEDQAQDHSWAVHGRRLAVVDVKEVYVVLGETLRWFSDCPVCEYLKETDGRYATHTFESGDSSDGALKAVYRHISGAHRGELRGLSFYEWKVKMGLAPEVRVKLPRGRPRTRHDLMVERGMLAN